MSETRYARHGEVHLAFQVTGEGPVDLLYLNGGYVPMDAFEEEPSHARFLRRLAAFSRLIQLDKRGVGQSDPISPREPPTLEDSVGDVVAVLDAAGSRRAAVVAVLDDGATAQLLAATHPDRVSSLVLANTSARVTRAPDYPVGIAPAVVEGFQAATTPEVVPGGVDMVALAAPSRAGDPRFRDWFDRAGRRGASPATAQALTRRVMEADLRGVLEEIAAPTLVLHRREARMPPVDHGRFLAQHIPGARFLEVPGGDTFLALGDADAVLDEIEEFVTGVRHGVEPDRALATILFTDIVGSTEQAARLGDRRWRGLLDEHDAVVRRQLGRFGGHEVKTIGDGVLATFATPTRAVECAVAIRDGASELGLEIREGVHTGEVEVRGDDIGGMAVNIAARVAALAGASEILVTSTVKDLAAGSGLVFADRGPHPLRGVPDEWRLFALGS